jgi:hypothetical protein
MRCSAASPRSSRAIASKCFFVICVSLAIARRTIQRASAKEWRGRSPASLVSTSLYCRAAANDDGLVEGPSSFHDCDRVNGSRPNGRWSHCWFAQRGHRLVRPDLAQLAPYADMAPACRAGYRLFMCGPEYDGLRDGCRPAGAWAGWSQRGREGFVHLDRLTRAVRCGNAAVINT